MSSCLRRARPADGRSTRAAGWSGREHLDELDGPVRVRRQPLSHMDTPGDPARAAAAAGGGARRWRPRPTTSTTSAAGRCAVSLAFSTVPVERNSGAGVAPPDRPPRPPDRRRLEPASCSPRARARATAASAGCARAPRCWPPSTTCRSCRSTCRAPARRCRAAPLDGVQGRPARPASPDRDPLRAADRPRAGEHRSEVMERVRLFLAECGADDGTRAARRTRPPRQRPDVARVFVTGASGFIGGALTTRLLERGDEVVGLARSDAAAEKVAARGAEVARGDLLDEDSTRRRHGRAATLAYHVAGVNSHCPPDPDMLLQGQRRTARRPPCGPPRGPASAAMVYTSSAASVGEPAGTVGTEDCVHRGSYLSVYDRSKHEGEQAVFAAARRHGRRGGGGQPVVGPGPCRARRATASIIIAYLNGKLPVFVDTHVSVVDIARLRRGRTCWPPSAGERGPALRAQRRDDPLARGARASSPSSPGFATACG